MFDSNTDLPTAHPPQNLHGHLIAIKDNIVTTSAPSSCASNILRDYVAPQKATVVDLVEQAGMLVVGKTNMDEFGMGSHNLNSAFGYLHQPSSNSSVGGSSGGSALAVALKQCHFALGTDTGGSVRLPAAYLNLCGFKPSYGMISRYGVVPYANSLDTVGILARKPSDIAQLFDLLSVHDPKDPTSLRNETRQRIRDAHNMRQASVQDVSIRTVKTQPATTTLWTPEDEDNPPRLRLRSNPETYHGNHRAPRRIGIPTDYNIAELHPSVRQVWVETIAWLRQLGHIIIPVSLPMTRHALSAYYILATAEASSNLAKYDGVRYGPVRSAASADADTPEILYSAHRSQLFGDEVQRRILLGAFSLSASAIDNYFLQAQRVRRLVQDDFNALFRMPHPLLDSAPSIPNGVDLLLCPTAPTPPPNVTQIRAADPVASYINDVFTVPASLAGLPAISLPPPPPPRQNVRSAEQAVGMQLIGQFGDDASVLEFAERALWQDGLWAAVQDQVRVAAGRKPIRG
jgi:aspartyl-tRNA(Asn)/glutamyl-tRNA(Gln) amidotransferase subunit A